MSKESRKKAMYLLQKQDRTEFQLRDKLKQSGFEAEDIEDAVTYVKDFKYLDDERFARNYVRYGGEHKSRQKLKIALLQKGISQEIIQLALEEEFEGNEREQIRNWLNKKSFSAANVSPEERQKLIASLYRKGFKLEDIKSVMGDTGVDFIED